MALQCYDHIAFPLGGVATLPIDAVDTAPPDAFGPFRVLHQIGAGALGPVYRAYQPELDRLVAVKVFCLDVPGERLFRFLAELEKLIAADLTHPAIAAPLGTGISGASAYLAQDFVGADPLHLAWRDGAPVTALDAQRIATQMAAALDFAAEAGIVHGALHPGDVLVSPDDTRLTGLGIAQALDAIGAPGPLRVPFTAPERAAGYAWDRRADVFSLAAVVFELLSGRQITDTGARAVEALGPVEGGDLALLGSVFARALAEDPEDRFETALEFADALSGCFFDAGAAGVTADRGLAAHDFPLTDDASSPGSGGLWLFLDEPEPSGGGEAPRSGHPAEELDFRARGNARHEEDEAQPNLAPGGSSSVGDPEPAKAPGYPSPAVRFSEYAAERSRSAVWPLVLALFVGLAVGAAATFLLLNRDRPAFVQSVQNDAQVASSATNNPPAAAAPPAPTPDIIAGADPAPPAPRAAPPVEPAAPSVAAPRAEAAAKLERALPPAVEPGRLIVRSTPAGARVFVDGRDVGVTPATIRDLATGSVAVRIVRDGYLTAERRVSITAARPAQSVTVALSRARPSATASAPVPSTPATVARPSGVLFFESRPSGASVFVDGKLVGTTPMQMDGVDVGAHAVGLERDGYRRWSSSVRVARGQRLRVSASLER
ncbi:MAG: PEGA domain-containing protein [Luteitalea sp.]|nr:PEGA domain-containing protein [Luteitalea sp.]